MGPEDSERRIADLERQLAQARRIADLEQQLSDAKARARPDAGGLVTSGVSGSFDGSGLGSRGWPSEDESLSAAPRKVPARFVLAELLPFRWWYLSAMFAVAVPAIIVWITEPVAAAPAAILTLVLIYVWQLRATVLRFALLRWGQVATVIGTDTSQASYFGGTTWYNAPLAFARGWRVTRPLWSGPSTTTRIRYALGGYQGELTVRGREYVDGVILADGRRPDRAGCVTFFPYDLDRDDSGNWTGRLRPRLVLGMVVWLIVVITWVSVATAVSTGYVARAVQRAQLITAEAGATAQVWGSGLTRQVVCNGGSLDVDGNENVVTATGHCATLKVSGNENTVVIDSADRITVSAIKAHVTYHSGTPKVESFGIDNHVTHG